MTVDIDSLGSLIPALRSEMLALEDFIAHLEARFKAKEPEVLAFVPELGRFERLYREAQTLQQRFPKSEKRPPLFGVPLGVKDVFHTDGLLTLAGTRVPANVLQGSEAECVTQLRDAGALILGKTVTTEFAYAPPGPTRNPHNLAHTPGGSSSGSAAAVAAGLCPLALGTQTIGSTIRPAAFCGVVGYKPSYNRISSSGLIPLAPSQDHVGLFAVDVTGVALAAATICLDWQATEGSKRPVLGVPIGPYLAHATPEGLDHFWRICERLAAAGYSVREVETMPDFETIYTRQYDLMAGEAARVHASWFAEFGYLYHPRTAALIERGMTISEAALAAARADCVQLRADITRQMDNHRLDLWISPAATGPAPRGYESTGSPVMNLPWTQTGLPTITLPSGVDSEGLSLGLQVAARWYADEQLLDWGKNLAVAL